VTKHVALLRGINVGTAKRVAMADLRVLMEDDLGYSGVKTVLNSGNVVFDGPSKLPKTAADGISSSLEKRTGVSSRVTLLVGADLLRIIEACPLTNVAKDPSRLFVAVPSSSAELRRLKPLEGQSWKPERFALGTRAAYIWCPDGMRDSSLSAAVAAELKDAVTTRNWATMLKLAALVSES
jgi:uncharacterized protein (DUF1697 family)